ncbi:MAG: leucine-rich repeat domain-containing protein [Acidobacteria bacterium]|nr:leucine-rich repeat domain-containing protein [Acidobacteriota bacterium]
MRIVCSRHGRRCFAGTRFVIVLGLLVMLGSVRVAGQGVCDRTPEVRDAIVKELRATHCSWVSSADLRTVTRLSILDSPLSRLRQGDFRGLVNLEQLDLNRNQLTVVPSAVFSDLENLRHLALQGNELVSLAPGAFSGLSTLEVLTLSLNNLTALPEGVFFGLGNLRRLSLSRNRLASLPATLFSGLSRLEILTMADNNLTVLPAGLFAGLSSVRLLGLSDNRLADLAPGVFSGLSTLEDLDVGENRLRALRPGVLDRLTNLKHLYIRGNDLGALPRDILRLSRLEALFAGYIGLAALPEDIFVRLPRLQTLSLPGNRLETLPEGIDKLSKLRELGLHGNPGSPFVMPLAFERARRRPDGRIAIAVRRIAIARHVLDVQLMATGGTLSESDVTIEYREEGSDVVVWTPASASASVTAIPQSVARRDTVGWVSAKATLRLDELPPVTLSSCAGLEHEAEYACLRDGRFQFTVDWRSQYDGSEGVGTMRQLTDESAVATFFDEENVELVFKLLDGRGLNRHFWVFYGALSDVEYTLSVTDRETGEFREYRNPPGEICGRGDTMAFPAESGAGTPSGFRLPDRVGASQSADCPAGALCLQDGRFQVTSTWSNPAKGETGVGTPIPDTDSAGYMWFFSPGNIELVLKVLDGRWFNDSWWVYASALTDVDYTITVLDTDTEASRTYTNNPARPFCGFGDIGAFPE